MSRGLLVGQTAIITGAGQGLGRAIALEFVAEGANVALFERNAVTLAETEAAVVSAVNTPFLVWPSPNPSQREGSDDKPLSLRERGWGEGSSEQLGGNNLSGEEQKKATRVLTFPLDVTDYATVGDAIEEIARQWGRIDILVNNAGIFRSGTILTDTLEEWRDVMEVNLEAVYMGSKLVAPRMIAQGGGRIINIASVAGLVSRGNVGSYNASKGGVIALTKSLAVELAPYNILANAIAPGFMRTEMMRSDDGVDLTTAEDFVSLYVNKRRIPMARAAEPEDVAGAAVFLASDYCRYFTGQVLVVDGGLMSTF